MRLDSWINAERGRAQKLAEHFNVTVGAISQWKIKPPVKRIFEIEEATGGEVTAHEMLQQLSTPELAKEA